jgi:signal transduction histidine kinase/CheY-like chemotaxis protein
MWGLGIAFIAVVVPYVVPILPPEAFKRFAVNDGYFPILAATLFAIHLGRRELTDRAERRFWGWWAVTVFIIALVSLGYVGLLGSALREGWPVDLLYLLSYVSLFLTVHAVPDRRPAASGAGTLRVLEVGSAAVFLVSIFAYFVLVPLAFDQGPTDPNVSSFGMFVTFDLFLVFAFLGRFRTAVGRWRVTFGFLALVAVQWAVLDAIEMLYWMDLVPLPDEGTLLDILWYVPFLTLGVAARVNHTRAFGSGDETQGRYSTVFALFVFPVALPILHLVSNLAGIFPDESRAVRELVVLCTLVVLLGIAFFHQRVIEEVASRLQELQRSTERRLALSQKLEALGGLAGGVAHDFNNVLAAIVGYGEVLREDALSGSVDVSDVEGILTAADRGKGLVAQILAFSPMRGMLRGSVSLPDLVKRELDLIQLTAPKGVRFVGVLPPDDVFVKAEEIQMGEVVANILRNACQAVEEEGGDVWAEVRTEAPTFSQKDFAHEDAPRLAVVSVRDSGPGMSPEIRDRIFDPFFTTREQGKGAGLGLAVVHRLLAIHGGTVDVVTAPGEGTTVIVRMPACEAEGPAQGDQSMPTVPATVPSRRLMVVDDEVAVATLLERSLVSLGYDVVAFNDPKAALDAFRAEPSSLDALITDQRMPGLTGLELAYSMRKLSPHLPVMLVTGFSTALQGEQAGDAGVKIVLAKPFKREDLAKAVTDLFSETEKAASG